MKKWLTSFFGRRAFGNRAACWAWRKLSGAPDWVPPGASIAADFVNDRYWPNPPMYSFDRSKLQPGVGLFVGDGDVLQLEQASYLDWRASDKELKNWSGSRT